VPTPRTWYLAYSVTIVRAYLDHRGLAERENRVEPFFINFVLVRVLYDHALVAAHDLRPSAAWTRSGPADHEAQGRWRLRSEDSQSRRGARVQVPASLT
jgi:hypothetical protein